MKNRVIPVLITLVLICVIGGITAVGLINNYKKGSTEFVDYEETYGLEKNQYAVILNNEVETYKAVQADGTVYIDAENVASYINTRFYWDSNENIFIYTKATEIIKAFPNEKGYHVGSENVSLEYEPVKTIDKKVYVAVEYIKLFTQCELETYTAPNRVVITTAWGEEDQAAVKEDTVVRYRGGYRSDILRNITANEKVTVLQTEADWSWTNVATDDGYVGWIENKYLGAAQKVTTTAPAFDEGEFTYRKEEGRICLAWHQVTNTEASSPASLEQALNNTEGITIVGPTWFYFKDTDGNLTDVATKEYVDYAHQVGRKVWAVFQNTITSTGEMSGKQTDKILSYTSKRENLISQLINRSLELGIDGINLDFEMILEEAADNYIQFVRELSVACRNNGLTFSIDNYVPLYTKHYNRAEQAKFADYLVIMGYDEYGSFSTKPGPVASIPFVRQGIEETLELIGGDSSKVINGIPFYTRVWETQGNAFFGSLDPSPMAQAKAYLQKYDNTVMSWDAQLGYNYGYYTSPLNDHTYSMWLEDAQSIAEKMKLIKEYNLAGVACWKLQQEDADVWPVIAEGLNY